MLMFMQVYSCSNTPHKEYASGVSKASLWWRKMSFFVLSEGAVFGGSEHPVPQYCVSPGFWIVATRMPYTCSS